MYFTKTVALATVVIVMPFIVTIAQAQQTAVVTNYPYDVPCSAVQRHPDGSWTILKVILPGNVTLQNDTLKNTRETAVFEQKCGAAARK